MDKAEALQKIKELQEYIDGIDKKILVPNNIKIWRSSHWGRLWLVFGDEKQMLVTSGDWSYYSVISCWQERIKCELIKCEKEDLKPWDTAYRSNSIKPTFERKERYCKILEDNKHVYAGSSDVSVLNITRDYRWKVVPVE